MILCGGKTVVGVRCVVTCLISVMVWFVWTMFWKSQVLRLFGRHFGQISVNTAQMKSCDLLVQMFWQNVDLASLVIGLVSLDRKGSYYKNI